MATVTSTGPQLGFQSLREERERAPLAVSGELPSWLAGTLVRVTPADLEPAGVPVRHWFDGLAMLHAFAFAGGEVAYANRFLDSEAHRQAQAGRRPTGRGFATDPCRTRFARVAALFEPGMTDNCNVNVIPLGERWLAMTETPMAIEFDAETLQTLGPRRWAGKTDHATAHPHHDDAGRQAVTYSVHFGARSSYGIWTHPDGSRERHRVAKIPAREPAYMHSFALTDRHAVLIEQPLVVNPLRLALGNRPFIDSYEWKPERGTQFLIIDRATGKLRSRVSADPFFVFHTVNAFEDGDALVVDLCAYEDDAVIRELQLGRLRDGGAPTIPQLRRYRLPLDGGTAAPELLSDERLELPRINYRAHNGRRYRYVYGTGNRTSTFLDQLVKVDVEDRSARSWHAAGCYPGEPVFVAHPDARAEDDGVLLSVVLDAAAARSFLLVLDAHDLTELARADAPHAIPFGFHGAYAAAGSTQNAITA